MQLLRGGAQVCVPQSGPEPPRVTITVEILKYFSKSGRQRQHTPHPTPCTLPVTLSVLFFKVVLCEHRSVSGDEIVALRVFQIFYNGDQSYVFGQNLLFALSFSIVENESMFIFHLWNIPG